MNIQIEKAHQKSFFVVHSGTQGQFHAHVNFKTFNFPGSGGVDLSKASEIGTCDLLIMQGNF